MQNLANAFGVEICPANFKALIQENVPFKDLSVQKVPPLFSKIEKLLICEHYALDSTKTQSSLESNKANSNNSSAKSNITKTNGIATMQELSQISIEDFAKVQIRVGEILLCESVPKSSKLLRLSIDLGEASPRVVLSGIAEFYRPDELIGKQVCVVANLKPAKIMGEFSYGMILASKDENGLSLCSIDKKRKNGSKVS